jgi:hypothetical protein
MSTNQNEFLDPMALLHFAQHEKPRRVLDDYHEAVNELREKGFTYREIASWLKQFGFDVDHNTVWRVHTKWMSDLDAHYEAEADDEVEWKEAEAEAHSQGGIAVSVLPPAASDNADNATKPEVKKNADGRGARKGKAR